MKKQFALLELWLVQSSFCLAYFFCLRMILLLDKILPHLKSDIHLFVTFMICFQIVHFRIFFFSFRDAYLEPNPKHLRWSVFLKIYHKKSFLVDVRLGSEQAADIYRRKFKQLKLFVPNNLFDMVNVVSQHLVYKFTT